MKYVLAALNAILEGGENVYVLELRRKPIAGTHFSWFS